MKDLVGGSKKMNSGQIPFAKRFLSGSLTIDGVDVSKIGLHALRSKISIIPQEPVLFSGSVRKNLDPFGDHDDLSLLRALEEVQLKEVSHMTKSRRTIDPPMCVWFR